MEREQPPPKHRERPEEEILYKVVRSLLGLGRPGSVIEISEAEGCGLRFTEVTNACKWMVQEGYMTVARRDTTHSRQRNRNTFYTLTLDIGVEFAFDLIRRHESGK